MSALQELVGKGKKFEDEEALAKGKVEADQFIDHLKDENKGLRDTIAELQDKLSRQEVDSLRSQLSKSTEGTKTEEATPSQLSTEDLERLVEEGITKRETQRTAKENLDKTNRDLIAHFGDPEKASEAIRVRAEALGISTQEISKMATKSPTLVMELIRGSSGAAKVADITKTSDVDGAVSTGGLANPTLESQFAELRRKNPKEFWSPKVQRQIFELKKQGKIYS